MAHIVAKRKTKAEAEKEAAVVRKHTRSGTRITVRKYGNIYGIFME
jgi:hypothetical protein